MKYSFCNTNLDIVENLIEKHVVNPQHKAVLKMRFVRGMKYQEIADHPDVKITSFRQVGKIISDYAPMLKEILQNGGK